MIESIIQKMFRSRDIELESIFNQYGRILAEPPIKGKLTKGKLKWRGIRHCVKHINSCEKWAEEHWFEQRGVKITPVIEFTIDNYTYGK